MVHMMRDNTEKLERHEARDRQTAEQLKKSLALLIKRMSTVDSLKAYIEKLDDRIGGVEQLINQVCIIVYCFNWIDVLFIY